MRIYGDTRSGNCYKIQLLCSFLGIGHEWVPLDVLKGETRTEEFLEKNPNGRIPLLELDDGRFIAESNAILFYLAAGTDYSYTDTYLKAKILEWLFFEQYSHEPYIAVARFINKFLGLPDDRRAEYDAKQAGGHSALNVMEKHLDHNEWLVGENFTIADIALYGYTHVAHEGGFDLGPYPAIRAWLARTAALPNYIGMR